MMIRVAHVLLMTARGGGEVWISNVLRYLCQADDFTYRFVSHTAKPNFLADELGAKSLKPVIAPPRTRLIRYLWFFFRFFRSEKIQIVHTHIQMHSAFVLFAAWAAGVPVRIVHSHSADLGQACETGWFWRSVWKCYRGVCRWIIHRTATHVFYVSRTALADVVSLTHSETERSASHDWIPPAVDVRPASSIETRPNPIRCRENVFRIACIGRMHESRFIGNPKNQRMVIATADQLRRLDAPFLFKFYLIGDGTAHRSLEREVLELGLFDRVEFTGEISDVPSFLWHNIDLVLAPSTHEGFGMTVVEAQLQGVPVIISENVPQETIISERLVTRQSLHSEPTGWADAVQLQWQRIQRNELDTKLVERQRILTLLDETVYTPEKNAVEMLKIYREAVKKEFAEKRHKKATAIINVSEGETQWR